MTAHSIAYTMARLREKMFVAVNKEDVEFDRQRQQSKYDRLDALFTEYARTYDNRPDEIRSPQAVDAIGDASREFVHRVMKLVAGDLDKEIINEDDK